MREFLRHKNVSFKFFLHRYHYCIAVCIIFVALALAFVFFRSSEDWKTLIPIIGGAISLIYIIEKQQLEEANLFKELFTSFNSRYDELNESLNQLKKDLEADKNDVSLDILDDYFNLCGEEYLYYRNGYIYPEVWKSWVNGMKSFYDVEAIGRKWNKELESGSYYDFDICREIDSVNRLGDLD